MGCASSQVQRHQLVTETQREKFERRIMQSLMRAAVHARGEGLQEPASPPVDPTGDSPPSCEELPGQLVPGQLLSSDSPAEEDSDHDRTVFIFDWDDTLCPTTWARKALGFGTDPNFPPRIYGQRDQLLKDMSWRVVKLLRQAQELGKVVLVTNASRSWVQACCANLMPETKAVLQGIPVIYAMERVSATERRNLVHDVVSTESKRRAMLEIVSSCQKHYGVQNRLNIVSIGDATYEHDAIRAVMLSEAYGAQAPTTWYTKTIKMLERPSIGAMLSQLSALCSSLPTIVNARHGLDIDLDAPTT